jgi:hypothetical protein
MWFAIAGCVLQCAAVELEQLSYEQQRLHVLHTAMCISSYSVLDCTSPAPVVFDCYSVCSQYIVRHDYKQNAELTSLVTGVTRQLL